MRHTSVYCLECVCGHEIETQNPLLNCPACGRVLAIQWQTEQDAELFQKKSQEGGEGEFSESTSRG